MSIFVVTTPTPTKNAFAYFYAEFREETVDEIFDVISRYGVIRCRKLLIPHGTPKDRPRPVIGREDCLLAAKGFHEIVPARGSFYDAGGAS